MGSREGPAAVPPPPNVLSWAGGAAVVSRKNGAFLVRKIRQGRSSADDVVFQGEADDLGGAVQVELFHEAGAVGGGAAGADVEPSGTLLEAEAGAEDAQQFELALR